MLGLPLAVEPKISPFFADPQSPSVVVAGTNKLQISDCRRISLRELESKEALSKSLRLLAVELGRAVVIALHAPDPVVQSVAKIADSAVRVSGGPAGNQSRTLVSHIVAIGVFQIERFSRVLNHSTTAHDHNGLSECSALRQRR